ncbi:type III-D CRISPR-associated protein Csx19 [Anaerolentibacter hominis]|uniref:type III-D CRISPR-associated protein Csx19 n=1 Tax=Anaerolentibacter hominis TaxID=3079009 RepID=UPI0031B801DD
MEKITSEKEVWKEIKSWPDAEQKIKEYFTDEALLYLELDDKVMLGRYDKGKYHFYNKGFDKLEEMSESLQRIILFTEQQELRLYRVKDQFYGRLRKDCPEGNEIFAVDEEQKIWGSIQQVEKKWNMLRSRRGSTIWVPVFSENEAGKEKVGKDMGIQVRKYFEFPDATEERGLVIQVDERMVGIYPWPHEEGRA